MYLAIRSIVPNPDDLLSLEVEEVAGVLLMHLKATGTYRPDQTEAAEVIMFASQLLRFVDKLAPSR